VAKEREKSGRVEGRGYGKGNMGWEGMGTLLRFSFFFP